jgi:hypothetical protein
MLLFDVTTPTTAIVYDEKRGREETGAPELNKTRRAFEETIFVELRGQVPLLKREPDTTATAQELRAGERQAAPTRHDLDDEVMKARDARLALLARKYEGTASIEDGARLQILTERLRKLSPRVTSSDVEQVTDMVSEAERIAARLEAVKKKFGLR